jgi:hypothetical protein
MPVRTQGGRALVLATLAVGVALLVGASAFVVWDRNFRRSSPANPGTECPTLVRAHGRVPLSAIGVHRVALIGDSIMYQPSCAIAESLAGVGIQTSRHAVPGTGLLNGTVDWLAETKKILAQEHPDVVVAIFVGNYLGAPVPDAHGTPIADDSPAFFSTWQQRAEALSKEVRAAGAAMYWVSPPPISLPPLSHAQRLFDGYRRIPGVHILTSGSVLNGPDGTAAVKKETCGHERVVRDLRDGVHLSDDGARIYGQQIAHDLTARIGVLTAPRPC